MWEMQTQGECLNSTHERFQLRNQDIYSVLQHRKKKSIFGQKWLVVSLQQHFVPLHVYSYHPISYKGLKSHLFFIFHEEALDYW